jgi:hypothetical protein
MNDCTTARTPGRFAVRAPRGQRLICFGILAAAACGATGCGEPNAVVVIDNGGAATMVVEINGQPAGMIEPGQFKSFGYPPGDYKFVIQSGGETLFDGTKTLEPSQRFGFGREYIWNPGGENRYAVCKVVYGDQLFSDMTNSAIVAFAEAHTGQKADPTRVEFIKLKKYAEPMPSSSWFELPPGVQYTLRNPPDTVYTRSGSDSRRALTRISREDHAQLKNAHSVENPSPYDLEILTEVTERALDSLYDLEPLL